MCAKRRRVRKGRPRQPAPKTLPDDLYDYDNEPEPRFGEPRGSPPDAFDVEKVPVTEEEIDIFERYFGDVLDRLFGPIDDPEKGLNFLSTNDKKKP